MALVPDHFKLVGDAVEDGRNVALVQRDLAYVLVPGPKGRQIHPTRTIHKLVFYPNGWHIEGQWLSTGVYRRLGRKGRKLSCSVLDTRLKEIASSVLPTI